MKKPNLGRLFNAQHTQTPATWLWIAPVVHTARSAVLGYIRSQREYNMLNRTTSTPIRQFEPHHDRPPQDDRPPPRNRDTKRSWYDNQHHCVVHTAHLLLPSIFTFQRDTKLPSSPIQVCLGLKISFKVLKFRS